MKNETKDLCIGIAMLALFVSAMGWLLFDITNDPIDNLHRVNAQVVSFTLATHTFEKLGNLSVYTERSPSAVIQLEDGTFLDAGSIISAEDCKVGEPAEATVRIGQLTHKALKSAFIVCGLALQ